ncbi:hypothetical protein TNCV_434461 [Trichonephila clavipes]|nr:hypothetical protein TNCV_434461 [Trichonephila clavipes]
MKAMNPSWVPEAPRKVAVDHFRLPTVHHCLRSHLYRIVIADSPYCARCDSGQPMTVKHSVVCPALISLSSIVEKYWRTRALMT